MFTRDRISRQDISQAIEYVNSTVDKLDLHCTKVSIESSNSSNTGGEERVSGGLFHVGNTVFHNLEAGYLHTLNFMCFLILFKENN